MTWKITTTTTLSASRAVTLAERIPGEPIKLIVLHPGTGAGGAVTIWDDLGRSVASTRIDALNPRHEAEFYSDRSVFNVSAAIDGNATLSGAGVSVHLVSRKAPDASVADGSTSLAGPLRVEGPIVAPTVKTVAVQRRVDAVVKNIEQSGYGAVHNSADRTYQHNAVVIPCSGGAYTILNWNAAPLEVVSLRLALAPTLKHNGVGLTWVNATFAGSAGATVPASTSETNNNRVPGSVTCDPVTFPADVGRTDDPTSPYRIIVARIETSEAWTLQSNIIGDGYNQNTAHECQEYFGAVSDAGGFTGEVGVGDGGASWYLWIPGFFSITPRASVPSIQTHGDSIMRQGWLFDAQKTLAAEGIRIPVASSAAGQSNKASSYARFLAERGIGRSSMYLWQAYSPNDSTDTLVCIANGYKYTRLVLADLWANDITPIIVLFPTIGANNAAKQNAWIGMRDWLTSLDAAKKIHFLDTSALSDPTTPWFYLPAMTSDGTHLSAAGVAVCAEALAKVIRLHV